MRRPTLRVRAWWFDVALTAVLGVVSQVELRNTADDGFRAGSVALNTWLVLLPVLPVVLRRTRPRICLVLVALGLAGPSLFVAHTIFFWSGLVPLMVALYTVRRWCDGRFARWSWLVPVVAILVTGLRDHVQLQWGNVTFSALVLSLTATAGWFLRRNAGQQQALAAALEQLAVEQTAREEAAVQAERSRIALEMHDVVAHAVSLMVLQVGAARMTLEQAGGSAPAQLHAAEVTGRSALDELRRSLGALRDAPDRGPLRPLPGLAAVEPLVDGFRAAGLDVDLRADEIAGLPASLQLSVYRVLQEALTNVLKHAGPVRVTARVRQDGDDVVVEVSNPRGRPQTERIPSGGHGLTGMRERVSVFGGRIEAGPDGDGYRLRARIPVPS